MKKSQYPVIEQNRIVLRVKGQGHHSEVVIV